MISGRFGFPSEMEDDGVLEIVKDSLDDEKYEEERRLYYVATTRAKKNLTIFTWEGNESGFLNLEKSN